MRARLVTLALVATACAPPPASEPAIVEPAATHADSTQTQPAPPTIVSPQPDGRRSHAMVALGDGRLLVVGGQTSRGNSRVWLGDAWLFDAAIGTWSPADPVAPRGRFALAHDAVAPATLLFGGYVGGTAVYRDTLLSTGDGWIRQDPPAAPPGRTGSVAAFDQESGVFVMFGGAERPFVPELPSNDTWVFDPGRTRWQMMQPAVSPRPASEGHPTLFELAMVYHAAADRMVLLIGGQETWAYDVDEDTWERRADPGLVADFMVAAAYHPGLDRVVTYGGGPTQHSQETWAYDYDSDTWAVIDTPTRPGPVGDHAMAYDPVTDAVYLYGGTDDLLPLDTPAPPFSMMWAFDGTDWRLVDE